MANNPDGLCQITYTKMRQIGHVEGAPFGLNKEA
jgi:hypothetical protein